MNNQDILRKGIDVLKEYVENELIPGGALAFVSKDTAACDCYGYKQVVPEKIQLNVDTIYDLASLSKVVSTTTLILKLIEEGYFSLDTPLYEIIPQFRFKQVTIKHLLTHTSGLCGDDKAYKPLHGKKEFLDFICDKQLEYETGSKVEYSDFGYILLGFVIEKFVGNLDEYAKKIIFDPLKMNNTSYRPLDHGFNDFAATELTQDRGLIVGVAHDGKGFRLDGISGNAGLFSNVKDLVKFVQMILNDGENVLSKDSIELLKKCYTEGLNNRRTLGWICDDPTAAMGKHYSDCCLFHTGFTGTSIYIDFKREIGIILLTNRIHPSRDNPSIMDLRNKLHDEMLIEFDKTVS